MPLRRLPNDEARLRVERGVERQRAMADVFKAVPLGPARRERQNRVFPIERLNGGLFIDGEDRRMMRGMQIEPDHIGGLRLEVGIIRGHVALHQMGLNPVLLPDTRHHHVMHLQALGEAHTHKRYGFRESNSRRTRASAWPDAGVADRLR